MRISIVTAAVLLVFLSMGCARAQEIDPRSLKLELSFKGRSVVRTSPGVFVAGVVLVPAGKGTADSLFSNRVAATLRAQIVRAAVKDDVLTIAGAYTDGKISVPFTRIIDMTVEGRIQVRELADFTRLPVDLAVASHQLGLPLKLGSDEHHRMFAFAGARRVEMFRQDMNDEPMRSLSISDSRAFRPYWDIGGVVQLPGSYRIWRSNHADTPAYTVEEGEGAPGWADYSEIDAGLTLRVIDPAKSAPWSMMIDARTGVFAVCPRPPDQPPVSGKDYGRRDFRFEILMHEGSWPALHPCELPPAAYRRLLLRLDEGKGYNHLSYACGALGIDRGTDKEALYQKILFKERVQPSVMLRLFYRGDAWRMAGIAGDLLGKTVPRSQPLETWEAVSREILEKLRTEDVPNPKE